MRTDLSVTESEGRSFDRHSAGAVTGHRASGRLRRVRQATPASTTDRHLTAGRRAAQSEPVELLIKRGLAEFSSDVGPETAADDGLADAEIGSATQVAPYARSGTPDS
jgi:hypothetical protein